MNKQNPFTRLYQISFPHSLYARLCLTYGFFAVFCQSVLILLLALNDLPRLSPSVLQHTYLPFLEYPLMSLALLIGGSFLIDYSLLIQT